MWLAALAAPTVVFLLALAAVRRQRRRPLALAAPVALALTVCFETVLLNALSAFQAVTRGPLLVAHGAVALVGAAAAARQFHVGTLHVQPRARGKASLAALALIGALAVPVTYSAVFYVPNNWDSMTYHLARVAHWMQHRSVGAFETNVSRQVTYPPGAEYLLLVLQVIAGSDRLANLVQLSSWLVVAFAASPLARTFGAPRRTAPWAALIFAAAPMAVLQASSTQNDLVASVVSEAVVIACLPFLHRRVRWRPLDLVLATAVSSAGVLVKPTALVIAAPFLLWAGFAGVRALVRDRSARGRAAWSIGSAALLAAVVLAPELARRTGVSDRGAFGPFLYAPLADPRDRALNVLRGAVRHMSIPSAWADALAPPVTVGCSIPHSMCAGVARAWRAHEDAAGSPASALLAAALVFVGIARWPSVPSRARGALTALPVAWLLFCAVFRDNPWIVRLHLPLFALAPLTAAALSGGPSRRELRWAAPVAALLLTAIGIRAACRNELRPVPNPVDAGQGLLPSNYYAARPDRWPNHVRAIAAMAESRCSRLGLFIRGDSYDYPLTWRAMQRGIAVRHVVGSDDWPCVVYSDRGDPPSPPGGAWCPIPADPEVFVRQDEAYGTVRGRDDGSDDEGGVP